MKTLLTISTLVFTVMFASTSFGGWTKMVKNVDGETFYVDFERIRKHGGYVYYWYLSDNLKPTKQGLADAQHNLGVMYSKGQGVIQDNVYAHMWLNIAASSGGKVVVKNRDILTKQMTPADISAAQKLARECVRKNFKGC